jgi:hypothetical protein
MSYQVLWVPEAEEELAAIRLKFLIGTGSA